MTKTKIIYVCDNCGAESVKWSGKCTSCSAWNSLKEMRGLKTQDRRSKRETDSSPQKLKNISLKNQDRIKTGISEFDRVVGGGIVPGSLILLAGDPGIGKSTLLLQIAAFFKSLYIAGEESTGQVRLRTDRLGILKGKKSQDNLYVLAETDVDQVLASAKENGY